MENYIITISRRFASKGHEIAARVGDMLQIPVYDRSEVEARVQSLPTIERTLEEKELREDNARDRCRTDNGGKSLWKGLWHREARDEPRDEAALEFERQSAVIRAMADAGPCIILGRCADQIFENHPRALHVFLYAREEERIRNIMQMLHTGEEEARAMLQNEDRARDAYRKRFSAHPADEVSGRHILMDSGKLGADLCAELLVRTAKDLFINNV